MKKYTIKEFVKMFNSMCSPLWTEYELYDRVWGSDLGDYDIKLVKKGKN